MKTVLAVILLLLVHNVQASNLKGTADSLREGSLKSYANIFKNQKEKVEAAKKEVCKKDDGFKSLSAENVWNEIRALSQIQKYTTGKYFEDCSKETTGNAHICNKEGAETRATQELYKSLQICLHERMEERVPVLAIKLKKRKIFGCTSSEKFLDKDVRFDNEVYFVNPKFAEMSFDEVQKLQELDLGMCRVGSKLLDLKTTLESSAFTKCIAPNPTFATCLKTKCGTINESCVKTYKSSCLKEVDGKEKENVRQDINACYWNEVANPTNAKTKTLNEQCRKDQNFSKLDESLRGVAPSSVGTCYRSVQACVTRVSEAFDLKADDSICGSAVNSNSNSSSGYSSGAGQ